MRPLIRTWAWRSLIGFVAVEAISILLCLVLAANLRAAHFILVNESGRPLAAIEIVVSDSQNLEHTRQIEQLAPGEQVTLAVRTSDLVLRRISFRLNGHVVTYKEGHAACWGEAMDFRVAADGTVTAAYDYSRHRLLRW